MKAYKIELLVVDHDDIGADGVKRALEETRYPNRCIAPRVMKTETREIGWADNHPLNQLSTMHAEYRRLFGAGADEFLNMIAERDAYRAMVCDLLASATPNERDHPAMSKEWARARLLLKNGPADVNGLCSACGKDRQWHVEHRPRHIFTMSPAKELKYGDG